MENYDVTVPSPDTIRQVLKAQDENIQHLRTIVSDIKGENIAEVQKTLSEQLHVLEEIERRLWATFFPSQNGEYHEAHRMTMNYNSNIEQYY